jgi:folate-binding protein YgfZ
MQTAAPESLDGYSAVLNTAGFYLHSQPGCLRILGADRLAFLQRQTTNDVRLAGESRSVLTVLTSPTARILDVLRTFTQDEALLALMLPGSSAQTAQFLKSRIFFMDKVSLEDASAEFAQIDLEGPQAAAALERAMLPYPAEVDGITRLDFEASPLVIFAQEGLFAPGYRLLAATAALDGLKNRLQNAGAEPVSPAAYQVLRVEAGKPGAQHELTGEYTPLEAGLESAISTTKGCYTGQEVIARQITYDKITQRLTGLRLQQAAQPGERVWAQDKPVGAVTSAALSPRFGAIALGVLRKPHFEPGSDLAVGADAGSALPALSVALPFTDSQ